MSTDLERTLTYHERTKHSFGRYARGPGRLDWTTQPDPFRVYEGARRIRLDQVPVDPSPSYDAAFSPGQVEPQRLECRSISHLFYDSLAISAWKRAGDVRWALRVNPSSGNLHPTEGYLLCGPVEGLSDGPLVAHYVPLDHLLEVRADVPAQVWRALADELPQDAVLVGLSSIHWREAWKYGERAFRYCQLDVGHALAAISLAAAGLGWQATLLDDLGSAQIAGLLGLVPAQAAEPEHPDCLLVVYPQGESSDAVSLPKDVLAVFGDLAWQGSPNQLSPRRTDWPIIDEVAMATEKPSTTETYGWDSGLVGGSEGVEDRNPVSPPGEPSSLRQIIRQRRSAVAMDPRGTIQREAFYAILWKVMGWPGQYPFATLPWAPQVHLALFVHRVEGLSPGLYILVRNPEHREALRAAMNSSFTWTQPDFSPAGLDLYLLVAGDARAVARQLSCHQDIASDSCFSLGMIAHFVEPLRRWGAWFYRRLYWECGLIGQVFYLEAEAAGLRGTGIGCFFDDPVHDLLGLETAQFQSLYHFTVGHPIEDRRLTTLPAYPSD
jgi:SagB-type dehydrogenase family enzyme